MPLAKLGALVAAVAALALGLAACGGGAGSPGTGAVTTAHGGSVYVYSSLRGAPRSERDSMDKAMQLAYDDSRRRTGAYTVKWVELDRSASATGAWNAEQVAHDARTAARDSRTVGYIGEFNSDATKTSVPILSNAGISSLSPSSTSVGLTTSEDPGGPKDEPAKFYPNQQRTFARLIPRDTVQAAALVTTMKKDGCTKVALAADGSSYGDSLTRLLQAQAQDSGVGLLAKAEFLGPADAQPLATMFEQQRADCFLLAARAAGAAAARLYRIVSKTLGSKARLYGTSALCRGSFTSPRSGLAAAVGKRFACVRPTLPVASLASAKSFLNAYRRRWRGQMPTPYAVYAYEAMRLYLDTIARIGSRGADRAALTAALHSTSGRRSAIGTFSIGLDGDVSPNVYALYRVGARGAPRFAGAVKPKLR